MAAKGIATALHFLFADKDLLIDLRTGSWTLERFLAEAAQAKSDAEAAAATSPLPDWIDEQKISALIAQIHLSFWNPA
jgi:hypothetical protein